VLDLIYGTAAPLLSTPGVLPVIYATDFTGGLAGRPRLHLQSMVYRERFCYDGTMNTRRFQNLIYRNYRDNPRPLPWRNTADPYHIMVSEVMLQQTQVERVLPKYYAFLARFPTVATLAEAPLADVLGLWQGLGYNRRGMMLKRAAEEIVSRHGGVVPDDPADLVRLSGIGRYTAGAIAAFAFGLATPFIETNIRSVFIHHFFHDRSDICDSEILPLVELTMDRSNIRDWYNALMDYGVMLKQQMPNPSRRSRQYSRQTPFRGSNREIRGGILKYLLETPGMTVAGLAMKGGWHEERLQAMLAALVREGLLRECDGGYWIA
jgi:A/G-specific adenine glycosylase